MSDVRTIIGRAGGSPSGQLSALSITSLQQVLLGLTLDTVEDLEFAELCQRILQLRLQGDGWIHQLELEDPVGIDPVTVTQTDKSAASGVLTFATGTIATYTEGAAPDNDFMWNIRAKAGWEFFVDEMTIITSDLNAAINSSLVLKHNATANQYGTTIWGETPDGDTLNMTDVSTTIVTKERMDRIRSPERPIQRDMDLLLQMDNDMQLENETQALRMSYYIRRCGQS